MVSRAMLMLALGYLRHVRAHDRLSRATQRKLAQLTAARTRTSPALPGMWLVRELNGVVHVVTVCDDGIIRSAERDGRSLWEVAREITGTRWSGPTIFA